MRFPIDVVFLDRELGVIAVREGLKPWRVAGRRKAKHILELRSGEAARRSVGAGARLRLIEPASAPVAATSRSNGDGAIRVLVGASDRRFLRVASFLLGRNGFAVSGATRFADVMDAVESGRTDVVVLDASGPERWTVRAAAVLGHNDVAVAVLVVADDVEGSPGALPKWGSFDRLVDATIVVDHFHAIRLLSGAIVLALKTSPSRLAHALPSRRRVALAAALLVAPVALWRFGVGAEGLVGVFLFAVLAVLAVKDLEERRIPNLIVLPATAIVLLSVAVLRPHHALEALLAAMAAAMFLFVPSLLAKGGVGMGDVKLGLLLGAALGRGVAAALLLGCLAASVVGVTLLVRHGSSARKTALPFAPFLAVGALAAVALGAQHAF